MIYKFFIGLCLINVLFIPIGKAQFFEDFKYPPNNFSEQNMQGWDAFSGDGNVLFTQKYTGEEVVLRLDATEDKRNIWYALTHTDVSDIVDTKKLNRPDHELRIETRIMVSHAPRRINMYLTNPGGGNYLREFDIPEANKWFKVSMVSEHFEYDPSQDKNLFSQVSFMDWGINGVYELKVDYMKVDVVKKDADLPQYGLPLEYRPELKPASLFEEELPVMEDVTINSVYDSQNLDTLFVNQEVPVLLIDQTSTALLKWDLSKWQGQEVDGEAQLELYTYTVVRAAVNPKDFGEVRVAEILKGNKDWNDNSVTYSNLLNGESYDMVINAQTIVDTKINPLRNGKTIVTIPEPVMQRLLDGKTSGLAIKPLGLISTALHTSEYNKGQFAARIRFNVHKND